MSLTRKLVRTHNHRLGQSEHGCCFLLCVVSSLNSFQCHIIPLHIVLASPNVVSASSCVLYPCLICLGVISWLCTSSWPVQMWLWHHLVIHILAQSFKCQIVTLPAQGASSWPVQMCHLNLWRVPATAVSVFPQFLIFCAVYILLSPCRFVIWPTSPPGTPYNNDTHLDWQENLKSSVPVHGEVSQTVNTSTIPILTICKCVNLLPPLDNVSFLHIANMMYVQYANQCCFGKEICSLC